MYINSPGRRLQGCKCSRWLRQLSRCRSPQSSSFQAESDYGDHDGDQDGDHDGDQDGDHDGDHDDDDGGDKGRWNTTISQDHNTTSWMSFLKIVQYPVHKHT